MKVTNHLPNYRYSRLKTALKAEQHEYMRTQSTGFILHHKTHLQTATVTGKDRLKLCEQRVSLQSADREDVFYRQWVRKRQYLFPKHPLFR